MEEGFISLSGFVASFLCVNIDIYCCIAGEEGKRGDGENLRFDKLTCHKLFQFQRLLGGRFGDLELLLVFSYDGIISINSSGAHTREYDEELRRTGKGKNIGDGLMMRMVRTYQ